MWIGVESHQRKRVKRYHNRILRVPRADRAHSKMYNNMILLYIRLRRSGMIRALPNLRINEYLSA